MDLLSLYKEKVSGSDLENFFVDQAKQYVTNQIQPKPKSPSSVVSPTPQVIQVQGSAMGSVGGLSKNTWIYIGVGGAVALVAIIVLMKK